MNAGVILQPDRPYRVICRDAFVEKIRERIKEAPVTLFVELPPVDAAGFSPQLHMQHRSRMVANIRSFLAFRQNAPYLPYKGSCRYL